jgi:hypothetical protein
MKLCPGFQFGYYCKSLLVCKRAIFAAHIFEQHDELFAQPNA